MVDDTSAESAPEGDASRTAAGASGEEGSRPSIGSPHRLITPPRIFVLLAGVVLVVGLVFLSTQAAGFGTSSQTGNPSTCGTWEIQTKPDLDLMRYGGEFRAVGVVSGDDVWMAGVRQDSHRPVFVHWDGMGLTVLPASQIERPLTVFWEIVPLSTDNVWALGHDSEDATNGDNVIFHWNGTQWRTVPGPILPESLQDAVKDYQYTRIAPLSPNDIWAISDYELSDKTHKSMIQHWDGTLWKLVSHSNFGDKFGGVDRISVISSDNIWARAYTDNGEALIHWNGASWSEEPSSGITATLHYLFEIAADKSGGVWAVGDLSRPDNGPEDSLAAHWDGMRWDITSSPNIPQSSWSSIRGIAVVSDNDVWAVVSAGYATEGKMVIHWDGASWNEVPSPVVSNRQTLYGVSATSNSDVWVVGESDGKPLIMRFVRCK